MSTLIRQDDLTGPEIAALLRAHLAHSAAHSPPESVHALDLERLRAPDITFWSAWLDDALVVQVFLQQGRDLGGGEGIDSDVHRDGLARQRGFSRAL